MSSSIAQSDTTPRQYCILGTAGHIDHGKSALVQALTGTDPDRLAEEKARGMTIVLGFAQMTLPSPDGQGDGTRIGIVDVPGHERFVRTMVAGATGIDIGMLLIAADDGVMPQTVEHVGILDLLGVETGLIAISKVDLVHEDRLDTVLDEIAILVDNTSLRNWPVIVTSAKTGRGLDELRQTVAELVKTLPPRPTDSVFRLTIDRVFAIRGRGTVVTGSVLAGKVMSNETLQLLPPNLSCKVREVQSHGAAVDDVGASQRAALNLTGIDREQVERGMELATPGYLTATRYLDARARVLPTRKNPLESYKRVRISIGTTEAMAIPVVVGGMQINPGEEALVQLQFIKPIVASFGQRFIIRTESSQATIGGGRVVRPVSRRFPPKRPAELKALQIAESSDLFERYTEAIRRARFETRTPERLACEIGTQPADIAELHDRLQQTGLLQTVSGLEVHKDTIKAIQTRALAYLKRHHVSKPNEPGVLQDRLIGWIEKRSAKSCGRPIFKELKKAGQIVVTGPYVAHHEFKPAMSAEDASLLEQLIGEITDAAFDPPAWSALKTTATISKQRSKMLEDLAKCEPRLVVFAPQKYMAAESIAALKQTVRKLGKEGKFKLADARTELNVSRRVVQPMLEYLDRIQFTRRIGDERIVLETGE